MVEDKKTDDYAIEMDKLDQGNKEFEAAPPPPLSRATSSPPGAREQPCPSGSGVLRLFNPDDRDEQVCSVGLGL